MALPNSLDPGPMPDPFDNEGSGGNEKVQPEVDPYRTTVLWDGVPGVTFEKSSGSGGNAPKAYQPDVGRVTMDIGGLRALLGDLLAKANDMSDAENTTLQMVQNAHADPSFWGQNAGTSYINGGYEGEGDLTGTQHSPDTAVQKRADAFAPVIKQLQESTLEQVSQALTLMGQWMSGVDQSIDVWATTDHSARVNSGDVPKTVDPNSIDPG